MSLAGFGCGGSSLNGNIVDGSGDGTESIAPPTGNVTNSDGATDDTVIPAPTPTAEVCNDGVDNDANGVTDCTDLACSSDPVCAPPAPTAEICDDGVDNDGDGLNNCDDLDCSSSAACTPPAVAENCDQAGDEDGNGDADCDDAVCSGTSACGGGSVVFEKVDPNRFRIMTDWMAKYGPSPVCFDCPDPLFNWKDSVVDPAPEAEVNKGYFEKYNDMNSVTYGGKASVTRFDTKTAVEQGY